VFLINVRMVEAIVEPLPDKAPHCSLVFVPDESLGLEVQIPASTNCSQTDVVVLSGGTALIIEAYLSKNLPSEGYIGSREKGRGETIRPFLKVSLVTKIRQYLNYHFCLSFCSCLLLFQKQARNMHSGS